MISSSTPTSLCCQAFVSFLPVRLLPLFIPSLVMKLFQFLFKRPPPLPSFIVPTISFLPLPLFYSPLQLCTSFIPPPCHVALLLVSSLFPDSISLNTYFLICQILKLSLLFNELNSYSKASYNCEVILT